MPDFPLDRIAGFEGGLEAVDQVGQGRAGKAVPLEYALAGQRQETAGETSIAGRRK
jgi:hypothetical protein